MRPVGPMLAQTATSVADALERLGGDAVLEAKLDGARVQVHRRGDEVAIFTRSLDDITARLPEVVAAVRALPVETLVADGEAIALHEDGRPHKFQVTASRFGTRSPGPDRLPLQAFLFDVLHLDGRDLLDEPTSTRLDATRPRRAGRRCASTVWSRQIPRRHRTFSTARSPPGTRA